MLKITILCLFISSLYSCYRIYRESDVYFDNGVIFSTSDCTPFTGTLESRGESTIVQENFCEGLPCGKWTEKDFSGQIIHKGIYLQDNILSESTHFRNNNKTVFVEYWQEGESEKYDLPRFINVSIIEKDSEFIRGNENKMQNHLKNLLPEVKKDFMKMDFDGIYLEFVNAAHNWDKSYYLFFDPSVGTLEFNKSGNW